MITHEDVESFLLRMQLDFEEVEKGMWVVQGGSDGARLVVNHVPPLLLLRTKVLDVPEGAERQTDLFRRLLEFNAGDLVHGAYALEENNVILIDALELENLDFNEFQASVDSMQVALASHLDSLTPFR